MNPEQSYAGIHRRDARLISHHKMNLIYIFKRVNLYESLCWNQHRVDAVCMLLWKGAKIYPSDSRDRVG